MALRTPSAIKELIPAAVYTAAGKGDMEAFVECDISSHVS